MIRSCCISKFFTHYALGQVRSAGRTVQYPYPLIPQLWLCNVCSMWFCIVFLKNAWTSLEKHTFRKAACCSRISVSFSALTLHYRSVNNLRCQGHWYTDTIPWQTLAFELADNSVDGLFDLRSGAYIVHFFQNRTGILIHLTTLYVSTEWWSQIPEPREVGLVNMVSLIHWSCNLWM